MDEFWLVAGIIPLLIYGVVGAAIFLFSEKAFVFLAIMNVLIIIFMGLNFHADSSLGAAIVRFLLPFYALGSLLLLLLIWTKRSYFRTFKRRLRLTEMSDYQ